MSVKPGQRVLVNDPSLARLREIYERATGESAPPNHIGTVESVWDDGRYLLTLTMADVLRTHMKW